jgi:TonB family protein
MKSSSFLVIAILAPALAAACGGAKAAPPPTPAAAPPVAVKAMPPLPDLSHVKVFTRPIVGTPTSKRGVTPAKLIRLGELKYPPSAWDQGLQGWVVFDFVVAKNGRLDPRYIRLVALSDSIFLKPAEAAVRAARFKPAILQGSDVASLVRLPVYFSMERAAKLR